MPTGVGPAEAAGLSEGSTEQSSSSREQKGINHLAVIRGSVSTGCLGAFLLPLNVPVCSTLRQMQPGRMHQPRCLQLLPALCQCCWRLCCQDGNGHFLNAFSALLHWRPVKTECASHCTPAPGCESPLWLELESLVHSLWRNEVAARTGWPKVFWELKPRRGHQEHIRTAELLEETCGKQEQGDTMLH